MTIRFLLPGKTRELFLQEGYEEYLRRLSRFAKVSLVSLPEESLPASPSQAEIQKALDSEAERALRQIKEDDHLFLVDIHGKMLDSSSFALRLKEVAKTKGNLVFLLGSSYGLSDRLRAKADDSFSLSPMTFTHYLALLLTLEQVYRAFKINSGEAYDK